ncbi:Paraneoplastic antigen Ma1 [Merluccius polli]|uniref:Paraneoplastic antigen Ma1 n=1 Tax=Merluccius polli TaxID=89951 RepID=A0AA47NNE1_MERPO|nr:Paraneoplastic antigen Ma1 [Merluccius polli]
MDTEQEYGVNLKMAVYVEGITSTDTDEQITKFCSAFGPVNKVLRVRQTGQETGVKALVEFESEESVIDLAPNLPQYLPSVRDPNIMWRVDRAYKVAPTPEKSLSQVRAKLLDSSNSSNSDSEPDSDDSRTPLVPKAHTKFHSTHHASPTFTTKTRKLTTQSAQINQGAPDNDIFNPPDVQRIIVEHVIKNDNSNALNQGSKRLRPFSGKLPKPTNEADFQTWSLHVELMVQDKTPVDIQRRKILDSLLPPASDLIRQLGPDAAPRSYVKLLDSAYGLVEDGEEIFARFLSTHQNAGEKASEYLQRLQVLITTAIKRGGIFRRGCWDQSLILALQLGLKTENPPNFSDFLLQVRTEEDRITAKQDRMQRHLASTKPPRSSLNMQLVHETPFSDDASTNVLQTYITETEALRKQVAELKMQLTKKKDQRREKYVNNIQNSAQETPPARVAEIQAQQTAPRPRPKAWFCFKCGNDGHLARQCENPPNKPLVDQKYKELKTRQTEWDTRYGHLNWTGSQ